MIRLRVRHVTTYTYRSPVAFGEHRLMPRPRESPDQRTHSIRLDIDPEPESLRWSEDPSGNSVVYARFGRRARRLCFQSDVVVDHRAFDPATVHLPGYARTPPFSYDAEEMPDLARFIERQYSDPEHGLNHWVRDLVAEAPGEDTWAFLLRLNARINRDFAYLRREEKGIQPPAQTLRTRRGSCRDFAVLMIEAARQRGMAARFMSGYLRVRSPGTRAAQAGGNTHAWLQVYLPKVGWIDFDPTSGAVGNGDLIRIAAVRDPDAASPVSGSFLGFPSDYQGMTVTVNVATLGDAPASDRFDAAEHTGAPTVSHRLERSR